MIVDEFLDLLRSASRQLHTANPEQMATGDLIATKNEIHADDVAAFGQGVRAGHVVLHPGGRFDTRDRPTGAGRWGLLSRSQEGGWFNAEYLPQLAAYVRAIEELGFPYQRVLFELPASALQLDLAILDDQGSVVAWWYWVRRSAPTRCWTSCSATCGPGSPRRRLELRANGEETRRGSLPGGCGRFGRPVCG